MAISQRTQEQIKKLRLNSKGSTGINLTKVPTIDRVGNLIVSTGGSGADLLLEAKGLISRCCCDGAGTHLLKREKPSRVRYLAFDTDSTQTPNKKSSDVTGNTGFDKNEDELVILDDSGLKALLDPRAREHQKISHPEIFEWIDTEITIPSGGNGAGGVRQAGRAMFFLNIDKIIKSVDEALDKLAKGNNLNAINIFLLCGISGGTGSGTFLDLAFVLRQRAEKCFGVDSTHTKQFPITIYGYLLGPDVNMLNAKGDPATEANIKYNGGAALQELDHFSKNLKEFRYTCRYSPVCTIDTTTAPFSHVHLICNNGGGGNIPENAYQHCKDIVAEAILNFVADAQCTDEAKSDFSLVSHYNNIANHNNLLPSDYPERDHPYLANGVSSWSIPSDRILKYIITMMFKSVDNLFDNAPKDEDVQYIFDMLACGSAQRLGDMMQGWLPPLPFTYTYDQLFKQHVSLQYDLEPVIMQWKQNVREKYFDMAGQFKDAMEKYFRNQFTDIKRGPVWCNRAMTNSQAECRALNTRLYDESKYTEGDRNGWITESEKLISEINSIMNLPEPGLLSGGSSKKQEYVKTLINKWNRWAELQVQIYATDLLIYGYQEEDRNSFYEDAMSSVTAFNNRMFDTTVDILSSLRDVVAKNDTDIQVEARRVNKHRFTWDTQSIPRLDLEISKLIYAAGVTDAELAGNFLKELLLKAGTWTDNNIDVSLFIENYLEKHAKTALSATLEGLLLTQFPDADSLSSAVENELLPMLVRKAVPMFTGNSTLKSIFYLINVPASCENIINGALNYAASPSFETGTVTVASSALSNRVSVICTAMGISLYDYSMYADCEKTLDITTAKQSHGLYLNQATDGSATSMNWKEDPLPAPIPRRYHLTKGIFYPVNQRRTEEERIRKFRMAAEAGYSCLKMERNEKTRDYKCRICKSERLEDTEFEKMTSSAALKDIHGKWDVDKLEETIAKLNRWIHEGLPVPAETHASTYTVIENISTVFTDDQHKKVREAPADQREEVLLAEAWNTADQYYLKAYEYYTTLEDEIRKYDAVKAKIEELEIILKEEKGMPARCANMIKMMVAKQIAYNDDRDPQWQTFDDKKRPVSLVVFSFDEEAVKELKAYHALEKARLSENIHQREWFDKLLEKTKKNYDDVRDHAIRKKDTAVLEDLRNKVLEIRSQAEKNMDEISERLRIGSGVSRIYTSENHKFYKILIDAADDLAENLNMRIRKIKEELPLSEPAPEPRPSVSPADLPEAVSPDRPPTRIRPGLSWTCPTCGKEWEDQFRVCPIDMTPKPEPEPEPEAETGTWKCPVCGREWDSQFQVCPIDMTPKPVKKEEDKTWKCPACGREWDSQFQVCPIDMTPRPRSAGAGPVKLKWTCSRCGNEWDNQFQVCPICNIPKH